MLERLGVNDADHVRLGRLCAAAGDIVILARGVKYCAIHTIGEFDRAEDLVIRSAHHLHAAEIIIAIRDDQLIGFREEERSMWLAEPGDAVKVLAIEIEHLNGLMVLSGEK